VDGELLEGQLAYYRARADEYDDWFLRRERHDRGPEWNRRWFSELDKIRQELGRFGPLGRVLELACGTGLWTVLARHATSVTAVNASPEVLGINRARLREAGRETAVRYVAADLFDWRPDAAYDAVFFGFWLSHVPPERFERFWDLVGSALRRASLFRGLARPRDLGRKGASLAGPAGPHGHPPARRRPEVPDRQGLLRPRLPRKAARRPGVERLRPHDGASPLRFRRAPELGDARDPTSARTPAL